VADRTFRRALVGIVLAALALRLVYMLAVLEPLEVPDQFTPDHGLPFRPFDEMYYESGARALADGRVFYFRFFSPMREQAYLPPLPSLVLTPAGLLFDSLLPMRLVGVLGGTAVVALVALVGRAVAGPRAGVGAAALAAVYPNLWITDGLLLAETWAALTTALVLLATYRFLAQRSTGRALVIGLACGLAALARSELLLLVPLLGGYLLVTGPAPGRQRLRSAAALIGAALLLMAPWTIYNVARFERPVLLTTGVGDVLLGANCPTTYYGDDIGFSDSSCPLLPEQGRDVDPSVIAGEHRNIALEYASEHVDRVPLVVLAREARVWSLYAPGHMATVQQSDGRPTWASYLGFAMYWCLFPVAVAGAIAVRRRGSPLFPLLAPVLVVALNAALFYGYVRYRAPAEVSLVLLAGAALGALADARAVGRIPSGQGGNVGVDNAVVNFTS
jgi:4-amino-4-deoxy-L-arabinose transferase-like glycosyltransferase